MDTCERTGSMQWEEVRYKSLQLVLTLDWKLDLGPREIAGSLSTHPEFHGVSCSFSHKVVREPLSKGLPWPFHFLESKFHFEICGLHFKVQVEEGKSHRRQPYKTDYLTSHKTRVRGKPRVRSRAQGVNTAVLFRIFLEKQLFRRAGTSILHVLW